MSASARYGFISDNTTVKQLIDGLKKLPPEAFVRAYDPNSEQVEAVTGLLLNEGTVEICTDEP